MGEVEPVWSFWASTPPQQLAHVLATLILLAGNAARGLIAARKARQNAFGGPSRRGETRPGESDQASRLCRRWRLRSTIWRAPEKPSMRFA